MIAVIPFLHGGFAKEPILRQGFQGGVPCHAQGQAAQAILRILRPDKTRRSNHACSYQKQQEQQARHRVSPNR